MENKKQVVGSSSSFTLDLFGPKESSYSSSSSAGLFGSVFGPSSTGLGRDYSQSGKQHMGSQYENNSNRGKGESSKDKSRSIYESETEEPCYFSSSIYYGGQQVYSPTTHTTTTSVPHSQPVFKKDGGDDDPNGSNSNSASRGNWWQGSLYY